MGRLYGGVCYAGIDTDPELRYPKGAGRVAFSSQQSYIAAISARFVQLQHGDIDKRVTYSIRRRLSTFVDFLALFCTALANRCGRSPCHVGCKFCCTCISVVWCVVVSDPEQVVKDF